MTEYSEEEYSHYRSHFDSRRSRGSQFPRSERKHSSFVDRYAQESEASEDVPDGVSLQQIGEVSLKNRPLKLGIRYYNYEGFYNRMREDDGDFGIEVFVAKPHWRAEVDVEEEKRDSPAPEPDPQPSSRLRESRRRPQTAPEQVNRMPPPPPLLNRPQPSANEPPPYIPPVPRPRPSSLRAPDQRNDGHKHAHVAQLLISAGSKNCPEGRIMRIRLRSQVVLNALAAVAGHDVIATENIVEFHRPFRVFEESHEGMKIKLSEMEKALGNTTPTENVDSDKGENLQSHDNANSNIMESGPFNSGHDLTESYHTMDDHDDRASKSLFNQDLEHMRYFVDFVERVVLPIRKTFWDLELEKRRRVCFEDIPYLFKPGSLAFLTHKARSKRLLHRSAAQKVWRMVSCRPAAVPSVYRMNPGSDSSEFTRWSLYSFDYDGERLVPIWMVVKFKRFPGEQDITSLECYPLALHERKKEIMEKQKTCGELFKKCVSSDTKHHYYSGWTFITGLMAESLQDHEGGEVQFPEHIESEIVIDFKETLQSYPGWDTPSTRRHSFGGPWEIAPYAEFPLRTWEDGPVLFPQHRRSVDVTTRILLEEGWMYESEEREWCGQDPALDKRDNWQERAWSDEDLVLLPRRVFAYVLRERKFTRLDVRSIEFNTGAISITLDQVQMKPERRRMIRSAVAAHFRSKQGPSTSNLDPIRGKGKGLVILLHGAPGVGKTATAEAVAAETKRPLFPITCGDLGFSPAAVDKTLRDIFRFAHLWNCILLFDEADIFLTQRERGGGNLERNALVGVFLRVLEYYSGILFLTTNRVGALDEAFRSRVHVSLSYPNLSLPDTVKILEANLKRLPRIEHAKDGDTRDGYLKIRDQGIIDFVSAQYEEYSKATGRNRGPWNGRQIRNAVQIAAGLALYEKQIDTEKSGKDDNIPAFLTAEHFRAIADTTSEFEEYLKIVKIGDEADHAKRRQERADNWRGK